MSSIDELRKRFAASSGKLDEIKVIEIDKDLLPKPVWHLQAEVVLIVAPENHYTEGRLIVARTREELARVSKQEVLNITSEIHRLSNCGVRGGGPKDKIRIDISRVETPPENWLRIFGRLNPLPGAHQITFLAGTTIFDSPETRHRNLGPFPQSLWTEVGMETEGQAQLRTLGEDMKARVKSIEEGMRNHSHRIDKPCPGCGVALEPDRTMCHPCNKLGPGR